MSECETTTLGHHTVSSSRRLNNARRHKTLSKLPPALYFLPFSNEGVEWQRMKIFASRDVMSIWLLLTLVYNKQRHSPLICSKVMLDVALPLGGKPPWSPNFWPASSDKRVQKMYLVISGIFLRTQVCIIHITASVLIFDWQRALSLSFIYHWNLSLSASHLCAY